MKALVVILLAMLVWTVSGCAGLAQSAHNRDMLRKRNVNKDLKLMGEDWDRLWLIDRPSQSTRYKM